MTNALVQPYLMFGGRCEEAVAFYQQAVSAQLIMSMRFSESPQPVPPGVLAPGFENKVMHCSFLVGQTTIMASDGCNSESSFQGFSLALSLESIEDAHRAFDALSAGGKVTMPLSATFWSPCYGMLVDQFGVSWMVIVMAPPV